VYDTDEPALDQRGLELLLDLLPSPNMHLTCNRYSGYYMRGSPLLRLLSDGLLLVPCI